MGSARRSFRRRVFAISVLFAIVLVICFGLLRVSESIVRSQTALLEACVELAEGPLGPIPRVLHQVFLDGEEAYQVEAAAEQPAFRVEWRDACIQHYSNWEYRFWTQARFATQPKRPNPPFLPPTHRCPHTHALVLSWLKLLRNIAQAEADELLQEQYPHFLPAWRRLNATVLRGDIIRYFIMDSVGGLYLDMDVECFWRAEPDLRRAAALPDLIIPPRSSACSIPGDTAFDPHGLSWAPEKCKMSSTYAAWPSTRAVSASQLSVFRSLGALASRLVA